MMTERELSRRARYRLAVLRHAEEVSGSVAATCRYYGISRQCHYIWLRGYEAEGLEGLRDRSSAPHHTPHATKADVVEKKLWLRQQYHFGPAKIAMYLDRYHDVKVSSSGVWRILKKVGRSHRIDSEEFYRLLEGQVIDDVNLFNVKLQEWEDYYNYDRPPRRTHRPDTLRTTPTESPEPTVVGLRQLHSAAVSRRARAIHPTVDRVPSPHTHRAGRTGRTGCPACADRSSDRRRGPVRQRAGVAGVGA